MIAHYIVAGLIVWVGLLAAFVLLLYYSGGRR